jgi:hypothetical protein
LIARLISHANTQVGLSDPVVQNGMAIAQEIKVTLGINIPFVPLILGLFSKKGRSRKNWVNCKDFSV